jgi:maltose/moltooligosaccharide transporter
MAATILGFLVKDLFRGESIYALLTGGLSMIVAGILVLFVKDVSEKRRALTAEEKN